MAYVLPRRTCIAIHGPLAGWPPAENECLARNNPHRLAISSLACNTAREKRKPRAPSTRSGLVFPAKRPLASCQQGRARTVWQGDDKLVCYCMHVRAEGRRMAQRV